jgi:SAM-dependent methyltransferase
MPRQHTALALAASFVLFGQTPPRKPDVIYVPTKPEVVDAMLTLAKVTRNDVVYDLGCGDGRIVIAAAKTYGARGVGIDIDPDRIRESNANARAAGVADKVRFIQADIFSDDVHFRDATVVMLYLLQSLNVKLKPKLWNEPAAGTRVVSHDFDMGDWAPERVVEIGNSVIYLWTTPKRLAGSTPQL